MKRIALAVGRAVFNGVFAMQPSFGGTVAVLVITAIVALVYPSVGLVVQALWLSPLLFVFVGLALAMWIGFRWFR